MKRTIGLVLLLAAVASGANDFTSDSSCVALWRFETGALTTDSIGTNTLVNYNSVAEDLVNYQEGACAADLEYDANQFFEIVDANQSADFPWKSGTTNYDGTVCLWFRPESLSGKNAIWSKSGYAANMAYAVVTDGADLQFWVRAIGYWYERDTGFDLVAGRWYHLTCLLRTTAKAAYFGIIVYDLTNDTIGVYSLDRSSFTNNFVGAQPFRLGAWSDSDIIRQSDGVFDEVVVFNRGISYEEAVQVRSGTYAGRVTRTIGINLLGTDPNAMGHYRMELATGDLGDDTLTLNDLGNLNNDATRSDLDWKDGTYSGLWDGYSRLWEHDSDLTTGWPGRGTDDEPIPEFTFCFWFYNFWHCRNVSYLFRVFFDKAGSYELDWLWVNLASANVALTLNYGGDTPGTDVFTHGSVLTSYRWYHVGVTLDDALAVRIRIWDEANDAILGSDLTGTLSDELVVTTNIFSIGAVNGGNVNNDWWGLLDDFVVFNRALTADEIDQVREGTYGSAADTVYHRGWLREAIRQRR